MKRLIFPFLGIVAVLALLLGMTGGIATAKKVDCTTIQNGVLTYSEGSYLEGEAIPLGYDNYGYNYQAHMFNGYYANVYSNGYGYPPYDPAYEEEYVAENPDVVKEWYWEYRDVQLVMKWNDAWLSNKDCDSNGKLDRHFGYDSYIGSGAWETNHQKGTYIGDDGEQHQWEYFVKIVAVPEGAYSEDGIWYTAEGTEIGTSIWGAFAIIESVYNDPYEGYHGVEYLSPTSAGFGFYAP
jgi:hypothetical protein